MRKLYTANRYWQEKFGCKVYRLSVKGGDTCPNRDGKCGTGGCIFCAEGSGNFAVCGQDIDSQLDSAKRLVASKCKSGKYIAYFQSYTATYGDMDELEQRLTRAAERDDIVAVSLGTRPDCLPQSTVDMLKRINGIKPVYIELGLQTASDKTAKLINRGYTTDVYSDACLRLHKAGLNVITHMIIGLPGETRDDVLNTARLIGDTADGIKIQLLHVLKGTKLYDGYLNKKYVPLTKEEYISLLWDCIEELPERTVVHRMTGDGDKKLLAAPMWSADKKSVLAAIDREGRKRNIL